MQENENSGKIIERNTRKRKLSIETVGGKKQLVVWSFVAKKWLKME